MERFVLAMAFLAGLVMSAPPASASNFVAFKQYGLGFDCPANYFALTDEGTIWKSSRGGLVCSWIICGRPPTSEQVVDVAFVLEGGGSPPGCS